VQSASCEHRTGTVLETHVPASCERAMGAVELELRCTYLRCEACAAYLHMFHVDSAVEAIR